MNTFDVIVIGGGIVGTSILRELSKYSMKIALLERAPDVCEGASKANSGIIHTGFDAKPNTLESRLLAESRTLWPDLIESLRIPYLPCGAVMVALNDEEMHTITQQVIPNALANGVETRLLSKEEVLEIGPYLHEDTVGGLWIEGESLVDPFWATRAYAEIATQNGAEVYLSHEVQSIEKKGNGLQVNCKNGNAFLAKWVINAAGLWSDEIARMVDDHSFTLTPRKGQFVLTEHEIGLTSIVLPVPNEKSKGILVTPVVFGGTILGPTAEDQTDKRDRSTNEEGLRLVVEGTSKLVPVVKQVQPIRQFAGVRAVCSTGDYVIRPSLACEQMIHVAGIRSTGVSASPGIAKEVERVMSALNALPAPVERYKINLEDRFVEETKDGEIVCLCRSITKHEINLVLHKQPLPTTLDGIKRRTGAMLGECQGNLCMASIMEMMNSGLNLPVDSICKHEEGSQLVYSAHGVKKREEGELPK